eukprot:gnl/TRDRNA2_/TRDRNA2_162300_c1_seq2.p1 gnl/TRDRNA2_/TRDRNA2_162300_c1~~gnl/TRDRNA2_/TRDRNA2_162300_c1_seq2.p1  ORF type:complete len:210 (-),score=34.48 gnl/TRDRNA2_/TRDRNA2_162300_c1_seq2:177-806(-)
MVKDGQTDLSESSEKPKPHSLDDWVQQGSEEAAEALWILSFSGSGNSGRGHSSSVKANAVDALCGLVRLPPSPKAQMWAAAALGNLAADYQSVPAEASAAVRAQIIADEKGCLKSMREMIFQGPSKQQDLWPSQASTTDRWNKHIVVWGALQGLRNVAMDPKAKQIFQVDDALIAQLCILTKSGDWLESSKSRTMLERVGMASACHDDL